MCVVRVLQLTATLSLALHAIHAEASACPAASWCASNRECNVSGAARGDMGSQCLCLHNLCADTTGGYCGTNCYDASDCDVAGSECRFCSGGQCSRDNGTCITLF